MPTMQEMQAQDEAFSKQYDAEQAQKASQESLNGGQQPQQQTFLQKWTAPVGRATTQLLDSAVNAAQLIYDTPGMRKARDIAGGAITGATNIADTVLSHAAGGIANATNPEDDMNDQRMKAQLGVTNKEVYDAAEPIWEHAKQHILDFRDAVQVQDPSLADNLTQSAAQLAIPFAGYSRALSGVGAIAKLVSAGALTDATALQPHDSRFADLLALGRHTEGKLGDALRALAPDGSAVNAYISYLADRSNESEAEGRFKNVLDGFGANLIMTPLLHGAATVIKQGTAGLRYMIDNGVTSAGGLVPPNMQRGAVGDLGANGRPPLRQMADDPAESLYEQQVREDMARAAASPNSARPPLRQGEDPAQAIFEDQARQDADKARAQSTTANSESLLDGPSELENDKVLSSLRTLAKNQNGSSSFTGDTHRLVSALAEHMDGSTEEGAFYREIFGRLADKKLDTKLVPPGTGVHPTQESVGPGFLGQHDIGQNTTALYAPAFNNNKNFVHTLAHETVHAATMKELASSPRTQLALDSLRKFADNADKSLKGNAERYGFKNVSEFVAEIESKPQFRTVMQNTLGPDGERSVWEHYKDAIAGMLGVGGAVAASPLFDKLLTKEKQDGET